MVQTRNLAQYAEIHRVRRYGDTGVHKLRVIQPWVKERKPASVLDYGAGQSRLINEINCASLTVRDRYDPAIPAISAIPRERYDLVICTDVFEHLDTEEVPAVLSDIARLANDVIFCIDTRTANAILPNGENAHATVRPPDWWLTKIRGVFPYAEMVGMRHSNVYLKTWRSGFTTHALVSLGRYLVKPVRRD
ncbi:hypothetical protein IZ6_11060 [Terrihabitans soli]|uniref:Class I SAM-dependent methyltransferase n=1 Tax=Terrihabitans soli TaxID=708113 RepID=A0A6S6QTH3_9HYPH|nr:class I SAM-dependent methyltransferase [Terrihabitans soli]BCJ90371.1 hypothetical protein IZ6_11060 [Terrihabitans soli]